MIADFRDVLAALVAHGVQFLVVGAHALAAHDVTPDGRRHLVILGQLEETATQLNVITNWLDDVRRRVGRP